MGHLHDNEPKHKSRLVIKWLKSHKIKVLQWPAQIPDPNLFTKLKIMNNNCYPPKIRIFFYKFVQKVNKNSPRVL